MDASPQCKVISAGCSRVEVPATSPSTLIDPADCSKTPLRHGWAFSCSCQRPGEICSTLPETAVNAKGSLSSSVLKLMRPSSNSILSSRFTGATGEGGPWTGALVAGFTFAGGNHRSRFQRLSEFRTKIKLGLLSDMVPNSKWPLSRPVQRTPALRRSARRKYSWPNAGSSPTVTPLASSCGLGRIRASKLATSTGRPNALSSWVTR